MADVAQDEIEMPEEGQKLDKGKGRETEESEEESDQEESDPQWHAPEAGQEEEQEGFQAEKPDEVPAGPPRNGDWEAIWSPQYNSYYFHNVKTKATTWENPLTAATVPTTTSQAQDTATRRPNIAALNGIDPELAYLDPNLSAAMASKPGSTAKIVPGRSLSATARFNARTGKFESDPNRGPESVNEFNRMKRQSGFYFDVEAWERQREAEQAAKKANGGDEKKRKPTKKELEMYKSKAVEKKRAKRMEWLYSDNRHP